MINLEKCKCPQCFIGIPVPDNPIQRVDIDPCVYETQEVISNCIVEISKCKHCGYINVSWHRTEDSISIPEEDWESLGI